MTYSPASPGSVRVDTPALDELGRARSCYEGITRLMEQGRLGELRKDIAAIEEAHRQGRLAGLAMRKGGASLAKAAARGQAAAYVRAEEAWARSAPGRAMAKAAELDRKAGLMADPAHAEAYRELAKRERAGAA